MRTVRFSIADRLILTPIELRATLKYFPIYALLVLIIFGLQPTGILFRDAWLGGWPFLVLGVLAVLSGTVLTPLLLPFIPSRSFAIKGWLVGVAVMLGAQWAGIVQPPHALLLLLIYLFFPLLASYLALQFTGATTFTSLSGVKKELRISIPVYIAGGIVSGLLLILYKLTQWGIV
jgi:hypothetical protein